MIFPYPQYLPIGTSSTPTCMPSTGPSSIQIIGGTILNDTHPVEQTTLWTNKTKPTSEQHLTNQSKVQETIPSKWCICTEKQAEWLCIDDYQWSTAIMERHRLSPRPCQGHVLWMGWSCQIACWSNLPNILHGKLWPKSLPQVPTSLFLWQSWCYYQRQGYVNPIYPAAEWHSQWQQRHIFGNYPSCPEVCPTPTALLPCQRALGQSPHMTSHHHGVL